jgi:hypothetical protein
MTAETPDGFPIFSRAAQQRSEGTMRSNQSRNRNLGIQNAQQSAKSIAGRVSDRPSMFAPYCASMASASRLWRSLRDGLRHTPTVTRLVKTRVTGGALCAVALERSGRHASTCRLAAR